jgi:hypothetical protein
VIDLRFSAALGRRCNLLLRSVLVKVLSLSLYIVEVPDTYRDSRAYFFAVSPR